MTRLCIIGNSHLGAVKLGWNTLKAGLPDLQVTFIGSPGNKIKRMQVTDGKLVPDEYLLPMFKITSGGKTFIDPAEYDVFVFVGATFGIFPLTKLHYHYRAESHRSPEGAPQLVSDGLFHEAALGLLRGSLAFRVLTKLRQVTDKPVFILPEPGPSAAIAEGESGERWRKMVETGDAEKLAQTLADASAQLANDNLTILRQPPETVTDAVFSKTIYTRGAVALHDPGMSAEHDHLHMNDVYGAIVLKNLFGKLAA